MKAAALTLLAAVLVWATASCVPGPKGPDPIVHPKTTCEHCIYRGSGHEGCRWGNPDTPEHKCLCEARCNCFYLQHLPTEGPKLPPEEK